MGIAHTHTHNYRFQFPSDNRIMSTKQSRRVSRKFHILRRSSAAV
jgi:hypothetical protein